ncbi:hypothetical protein [Amycolatopsis minnesotensis]|uniref:Peptidase S1 n=1 Tax=Amycolatopsis minnesotensis TaxID=337894 RepID=A0ABP5CHV6_9PSEU
MKRTRAGAVVAAAVLTLLAGEAASASSAAPTVRIGGGSGIVFGHNQPIPAQNAEWCTLTAIGYDRTGELVGLTNAHCFYDANGNKTLGDKVYYDKTAPGTAASPLNTSETDLETGVIGTVEYVSKSNPVASPNDPGLDYSVIKFDRTKVVPTSTVGETTITGIGSPPVPGTRMCKQGQSSGLTCGFELSTSGPYFAHTILEFPGDSGSPVVLNGKLIGNQWVAGLSTSMVAIKADLDSRGEIGAGFTVAP